MRLISIQPTDLHLNLQLKEFGEEDVPPYAILSHRWGQDEVSFQDMQRLTPPTGKGYEKIRQCCAMAFANDIHHVWIDTCCIDKTSSSELSEAINSMYRWYQEATVCYAFLADIKTVDQMPQSQWFTRGWTLQELIAPAEMIFFNHSWKELGSKKELKELISGCTGIATSILDQTADLESVCIAQRMSWAAKRKTARLEDQAYCLLGIFGINMPMLYGEGKNAFIRLQEEILRNSSDESIFAWKSSHGYRSGLLADSPSAFEDCADVTIFQTLSKIPWSLSNKGLQLELRFVPFGPGGLGLAILGCQKGRKEDKVRIAIYLRDTNLTLERFERVRCDEIRLLDMLQYSRFDFKRRLMNIDRRRLNMRQMDEESSLSYDELLPIWLSGKGPSREFQDTAAIDMKDTHGYIPITQWTKKDFQSKSSSLLDVLGIKDRRDSLQVNGALRQAARLGQSEIVWFLTIVLRLSVTEYDWQLSPLLLATEEGHEDVVWIFLTLSEIDVNSWDKGGRTPLFHAARAGRRTMLRMLMARDDCLLDTDHPNKEYRRSVLSHAAECGQEDIVRIILRETEIGCDFEDENGQTPLSWAAKNGHDAIVKILLASGADVDTMDLHGRSPLWYAIRNGRMSTISLLVKHHATVKPTVGNKPVSFTLPSAHDRESGFIELLLSHGIAFGPYDVSNENILTVAAENGDWDAVDSLIRHKIDVKVKNKSGISPLAEAAERGDEILVRKLLSYNPDTESDDFYAPPIYKAVKKGHGKIVELLLDHGAPPNLTIHIFWGDNLLSIAAREGHTNIVRQLLSHGADPNSPIKRSEPLIYQAAENGWEDIARLLLSHGADPNVKYLNAKTSLFATKSREMAMILLQYGADPNIQSSEGVSAGEVLRENGILIEEIHKEASMDEE